MSDQQPWIIAYDIGDDRRRLRTSRLLASFGERVQKSVFLCHLNTHLKQKMDAALGKLKLEDGDLLYLFRVSAMEDQGKGKPIPLSPPSYFIVE